MISKQTWQTLRSSVWLVLGSVCLLITLILWGIQIKKNSIEEVQIATDIQTEPRAVQSEKLAFRQNLGAFPEEVPAIDLSKRIVVSGNHEAEFRGSKFVAEHQKSWTLQIMKVTEEDIIRSYLDKREDRKNFYYLRLQDGKNIEQFVLFYGLYKDVQDTINQTQAIHFELPESIKVTPEKISSYLPLVNDLGSDEQATGAKLRGVILTKTALPKVEVAKPVTEPAVASTSEAVPLVTKPQTEKEKPAIAPKNEVPKVNNNQNGAVATKQQQNEAQVADPF